MSLKKKEQEIEKQINEKKVLEYELKQIKKGAKVYKQQPNSHVFFREDATKILSECKYTLDKLIEEYKQCETMTEEAIQEEEASDTATLNF